ncbi:MAG: c-type cytochrome [Alphaproteobacteria bacterium]|nr:c-type cytochrome [Alphaproteobacteria bacterium]
MLKRGFEIEISADGKPIKREEKVVDLASLMKLADIDRGAKIFKKCATCHTAGKGEAAKIGPNLFGIVGRARATTSFTYSDAMKAKGGAWDQESINQFITKPKDFVPGTKMAFPGLKKPQDRADVILFLEKQK